MSKTIGRGFFAFISIVLAALISVLAQRFFESMTIPPPSSSSTPPSGVSGEANSGEINSGEANSGDINRSSTDARESSNEQENDTTRIMDEFWDKLNR